jgi:hypothetical protein
MKALPLILAAAGFATALCSCMAAIPPLPPVGPETTARAFRGNEGSLQVFTATTTAEVDFEAYFHPHTGYRIEDAAGNTVQFVPNHPSEMSEQPDVVTLAPGTYRVVAESTWCGLVTVPVVIEQGRATTVHLDGSGRGGSNDPAFVHLPNGETVGWRAASLGT